MSTTQQAENIVTTANTADLSVISLILSSDFVGKFVIITLILASIWSWAIIVSKVRYYSNLKKKMGNFENLFWSGQALDDLYEIFKRTIDNPLALVFINAMDECKKNKKNNIISKTELLKIGNKERVIQSMNLAKNREIEQLEKKLGFLATVGSASPFIGLFGTVWGIMHSFQSIAASKNTSLAIVAPGIAEALLATAIGLFAAIPAVIFYNYLSAEVDNIYNKIEDFSGELNTLLSRAIDEEKI